MHYVELKQKLKDFIVFSSTEVKKLDPSFYESRFTEWMAKGYIRQIVRGFYIFSDIEITEEVLFVAANRIYNPSYISLESALRHYNFIPEGVYTITSVTSRRTYSFDTDIGQFKYRRIKPELMVGYDVHEFQGNPYKLAEPEKAILDYFYLNKRIATMEDLKGMRLDTEELQKKLDPKKLDNYLALYKNDKSHKRIDNLIKLVASA